MSATVNDASGFDAVSNHMAMAMRALWRHSLNRAFKAVERHGLSGLRDAECLVVVIAADITDRHWKLPLLLDSGNHRRQRADSTFGSWVRGRVFFSRYVRPRDMA
jgi:hypothetical protein